MTLVSHLCNRCSGDESEPHSFACPLFGHDHLVARPAGFDIGRLAELEDAAGKVLISKLEAIAARTEAARDAVRELRSTSEAPKPAYDPVFLGMLYTARDEATSPIHAASIDRAIKYIESISGESR